MTRRGSTMPLVLPPRERGTTAALWIYDALRESILSGRLRPGARLPGTRELALQHGLARGTVVNAYERLISEGYLEGVVGSGTRVAANLPDALLEVGVAKPAVPAPAERRPPSLSAFARRVRPFPTLGARPVRAFRANLPALDLFPTALWAQLASRRQRRVTASQLEGCDPLGLRPLREAIADYLVTARGVRCSAEQVAVLSGAQEALDLAARLLVDPGDRVAVEDPGYPAAALALEAAGARLEPVPVDAEGMTLPARRGAKFRLAYVTPAHQYPLGVAMTLKRRLELLDWARRGGTWLFEDDYDSEYRYSGRPLPALQGLDAEARVLFAGSFNKVLFPALRLGYLVLPPDLVEPVAAARSIAQRHPPVADQLVLLDFLAGGHFGRHLRRMRAIYAERLELFLEAGREELGAWLELSPVEAGLQTVGRLTCGLGGRAVERAAAERGVEVVQLERHWRGPGAFAGLQLGFAAVDERRIRRGLRDLAGLFAELRPGGRLAAASRGR
jgi:GntR family transcriptional regulator/MocR family aminotransferase